MNVRVPTIDALDRCRPPTGQKGSDELTEHRPPGDNARDRLANCVAHLGRNVAPTRRFLIRPMHGLFHHVTDAILDVFALVFTDVVPHAVIVHRIDPIIATGLAFTPTTWASLLAITVVVIIGVTATGFAVLIAMLRTRILRSLTLTVRIIAIVAFTRVLQRVLTLVVARRLATSLVLLGLVAFVLSLVALGRRLDLAGSTTHLAFLLLLLLGLFHECIEVLLRRLKGLQPTNQSGNGSSLFFLLRQATILVVEINGTTGDQATLGQRQVIFIAVGALVFRVDQGIDRQISCDIPHTIGSPTTGSEVAKDEMVVLVLQDTSNLTCRVLRQEVGIVHQRHAVELGVPRHRAGRDTTGRNLVNTTRDFGVEDVLREKREQDGIDAPLLTPGALRPNFVNDLLVGLLVGGHFVVPCCRTRPVYHGKWQYAHGRRRTSSLDQAHNRTQLFLRLFVGT